jgi:hypothetical protein
MAEGKSSRKWYHLGRQQMLSWSIKNGRERDDCTFASRPDEITPVGTEIAAARIQVINPAGVTNNPPMRGDR